MSKSPLPVVLLMGPTCSGKTDLAVALAQSWPIELINVDSALVYRGLDIGAARPDTETLAVAPHHLMGTRELTEPYSVADFRQDALNVIRGIHQRGRIPLLVGGTLLYFRALVGGLASLPAADPEIRAKLDEEARQQGWPALHARLAEIDPETAARLAPNDRQRLQRALEVYLLTGLPLSEHHRRHQSEQQLSDSGKGQNQDFAYTLTSMAVAPASRELLHARIARRFQQMLEAGLVDEVRQLQQRPELTPDLPALRTVGYRQVWRFLDGDISYDEMVHKATVATRQLAKRQFTWLRNWPDLHWLDTDSPDLQLQAEQFLQPAVMAMKAVN